MPLISRMDGFSHPDSHTGNPPPRLYSQPSTALFVCFEYFLALYSLLLKVLTDLLPFCGAQNSKTMGFTAKCQCGVGWGGGGRLIGLNSGGGR